MRVIAHTDARIRRRIFTIGRVLVLNTTPAKAAASRPGGSRSHRKYPPAGAAAVKQGLTLVHFSAQPELFLIQNTPTTLHNAPKHPLDAP